MLGGCLQLKLVLFVIGTETCAQGHTIAELNALARVALISDALQLHQSSLPPTNTKNVARRLMITR